MWIDFLNSYVFETFATVLWNPILHFLLFFYHSMLGAPKRRHNISCAFSSGVWRWIFYRDQQCFSLPPSLLHCPLSLLCLLAFALTQHICLPPPTATPKALSLPSFRSGQLSTLYLFYTTVHHLCHTSPHLLPDSFPCNIFLPFTPKSAHYSFITFPITSILLFFMLASYQQQM